MANFADKKKRVNPEWLLCCPSGKQCQCFCQWGNTDDPHISVPGRHQIQLVIFLIDAELHISMFFLWHRYPKLSCLVLLWKSLKNVFGLKAVDNLVKLLLGAGLDSLGSSELHWDDKSIETKWRLTSCRRVSLENVEVILTGWRKHSETLFHLSYHLPYLQKNSRVCYATYSVQSVLLYPLLVPDTPVKANCRSTIIPSAFCLLFRCRLCHHSLGLCHFQCRFLQITVQKVYSGASATECHSHWLPSRTSQQRASD